MPLFDLTCKSCNEKFEDLVSGNSVPPCHRMWIKESEEGATDLRRTM